jgi:hypothetical protein
VRGYGRHGYLRDLWDMHGSLYDGGEDERVEADLLAAFEEEIAPMMAGPLPAEVVEGEADGADAASGHGGGVAVDGAPEEATLQEIGDALGVCRERARCVIVQAQHSFAKSWKKLYPGIPNPLQ